MENLLKPGAIVDERFEVLRKIRSGGMGEIHLARELQTNRQVVIKEPLLGTPQDPVNIEKIGKEAEILRHLSHPGIVKFVDYLADRNLLILGYLEGKTLEETYGNRSADEDLVASIMKQVLETVGYLHGVNVIHRDICPHNFLLTGGKPILIDFGTAAFVESISESKGTRITHGLYSAPELVNEGRFSKESDIFSVGATFYFLLTGRAPDTIPPRSVKSVWNKVIERATRIGRLSRYSRAEEMLNYVSELELETKFAAEIEVVHSRIPNFVGKKFQLNEDTVTIGRGVKAAIQIEDAGRFLGGEHARFTRREGGWFLRDLGSVNGTFLNEKRLTKDFQHRLSDGDEIWLCYNEDKPTLQPYLTLKFIDVQKRIQYFRNEMKNVEVEIEYPKEISQDQALVISTVLRNHSDVSWGNVEVDLTDAGYDFVLEKDKLSIARLNPGERILRTKLTPIYVGRTTFAVRVSVEEEHLVDRVVEVCVAGREDRALIGESRRGYTLVFKSLWLEEVAKNLKQALGDQNLNEALVCIVKIKEALLREASSEKVNEYIQKLDEIGNRLAQAKVHGLSAELKEHVCAVCDVLLTIHRIHEQQSGITKGAKV